MPRSFAKVLELDDGAVLVLARAGLRCLDLGRGLLVELAGPSTHLLGRVDLALGLQHEDELVESIARTGLAIRPPCLRRGEPFAPPHLVQAYVAVSSMMPLSTRRSGVK